ncbi:hypothetical protein RirG_142810 [Rhizophagus irregularis DAOM 197198w]|uniref:Uncharacterized protein n=1 Tax=Rhizophagus irregularis (strain DAOM 197198w) TaxID=1432141 RepID=A0A015J4I9_RHIIW|nr:hypothetical protein RirG_142810 [Rhizophagus irregularis DAOM 197198w]
MPELLVPAMPELLVPASGIQLGTRNSLLIKNNESFSERVCQLEDEAREFKNEINQKEISLASTKSEIATKLEEIQALQSRIEELEQDVSLVQKRLSEMDFLKRKSELEYIKLSDENISLELANTELEDTLAKKKDELMRVRDDLLSAQKAVIEKDSLLQETNFLLLEHISKTSSESKQNEAIGGDKRLEKACNHLHNSITNHIHLKKNQKTGLPLMKLRLLDMDETFSKLVTGKSGSGKTNLLGNLVLGDKDEYVQRGEEGGSRYIKCDDLIVCRYHPDEPKWGYVRYIYNMISKDPKAPFYEDISFKYIPPERIPSTRAFSPERSTLIIFEDLCLAPEHIQNRISQFFGNGRHRNISSIYVTQKYHKVPTFIRENISHLVMYNGGGSQQDVSKIVGRYTDDVKNASIVINSYL